MQIIIRTPGGEAEYYVPVLHVRDYTMETIFEKRLFFLIPFLIFNIESEFSAIDVSSDKLDALQEFYIDMMHKLEEKVLEGQLTEFSYLEIRDMTNRVVWNLARNYENIRERISDIMGGKVLVTEASKIRSKAREEMAVEMVENMLSSGMTPEMIAQSCKLALDDIKMVQKGMLQKQMV